METERYKLRKEQAQNICALLKSSYNASICEYDPTTVVVAGITDKQHTDLCRELKCSGFYSDETQTGFFTNFSEYK